MSLVLKKQLQMVVKSLMTIINKNTSSNLHFDFDIVDLMIEEEIIDPISNKDNKLYTDKDGKIYVL